MSADEELLKAIPCTERYQPRYERSTYHTVIHVSSDALQSGSEKSVSTDNIKDTCASGLNSHPSTDHFSPVLISGRVQRIQLRPEELNLTKDTSGTEDISSKEFSEPAKTADHDIAKPPLSSKDQAGSFNLDRISLGAQVDKTWINKDAIGITGPGVVEKNASISADVETVANELNRSHGKILSAEDKVTGSAEVELIGQEAAGQPESNPVAERTTCQPENTLAAEKIIDQVKERLIGNVTISQSEKNLEGEKIIDYDQEKLEDAKSIGQTEDKLVAEKGADQIVCKLPEEKASRLAEHLEETSAIQVENKLIADEKTDDIDENMVATEEMAGTPQNKLVEDVMVSEVEDKVIKEKNTLTVAAQADDKLVEKVTGHIECKTVGYEESNMKGEFLDIQQPVYHTDEPKEQVIPVLSYEDDKLNIGQVSGKISAGKVGNELLEQPFSKSAPFSASEVSKLSKPTTIEAGLLLAERMDMAQNVNLNEDEIYKIRCEKFQSVEVPPKYPVERIDDSVTSIEKPEQILGTGGRKEEVLIKQVKPDKQIKTEEWKECDNVQENKNKILEKTDETCSSGIAEERENLISMVTTTGVTVTGKKKKVPTATLR